LKTTAIIQARMGSTRLPGKVLMKIKEKEMLLHIIDFVKQSNFVDTIIVATTDLSEDDIISDLLDKHKIICFRGDSQNVLNRYYESAKKYQSDIIVRLTGDNPIVNPKILDTLIKDCIDNNLDYASNLFPQTFPYGYSPCEVFPFYTLEKLHKICSTLDESEHVTHYIRKNPELFKIGKLLIPKKYGVSQLRLTVDYKEDFEFVSKIFSKISNTKNFITLDSLLDCIKENPTLLTNNKNSD
jgi:spore coat polysaccharide biosynthesis protein SpsF